LFILLSIFLPIIIFIAPINVKAIQGNLDLSSAQTSVGKRFAKVFCHAKREGLDSDFASEYDLNNTYLKFVAFPDDDEYLADLWNFTHNNILDNCGEFVDLNDDQYCIDLAKKNMKGLKRILKKGGVITAQVGSQDKKPKQVDNWCKVLGKSFGNVKLSGAYIPSFDCKWNFASSIMK